MKALSLLIKPSSSSCNLRCKYCFYADVSDNRETKNYGMMDLGTLEELVKKAFDYADTHIQFAFQGGEPMLSGLAFFRQFIALQSKYNRKNISVSNAIQTNGTLIDAEWAKFFKENGFLVGVSLDGVKQVHDENRVDAKGSGTFDQVIENIGILEQYGAQYNILTVINRQNCRFIGKIYDFFKRQGYGFLQFIPCIDDFGESGPYALSARQLQIFLNTLFDLWFGDFLQGRYVSIRDFDNYVNILKGRMPENCSKAGVCGRYYTVEADGTLFPCDFYCIDKWKIANIKDTDFAALEENEVTKRFIGDSRLLSDGCLKCKYHFICRGGCKRDREPDYTKNKYCEAYYNFFDYAIDRMLYIAKNTN